MTTLAATKTCLPQQRRRTPTNRPLDGDDDVGSSSKKRRMVPPASTKGVVSFILLFVIAVPLMSTYEHWQEEEEEKQESFFHHHIEEHEGSDDDRDTEMWELIDENADDTALDLMAFPSLGSNSLLDFMAFTKNSKTRSKNSTKTTTNPPATPSSSAKSSGAIRYNHDEVNTLMVSVMHVDYDVLPNPQTLVLSPEPVGTHDFESEDGAWLHPKLQDVRVIQSYPLWSLQITHLSTVGPSTENPNSMGLTSDDLYVVLHEGTLPPTWSSSQSVADENILPTNPPFDENGKSSAFNIIAVAVIQESTRRRGQHEQPTSYLKSSSTSASNKTVQSDPMLPSSKTDWKQKRTTEMTEFTLRFEQAPWHAVMNKTENVKLSVYIRQSRLSSRGCAPDVDQSVNHLAWRQFSSGLAARQRSGPGGKGGSPPIHSLEVPASPTSLTGIPWYQYEHVVVFGDESFVQLAQKMEQHLSSHVINDGNETTLLGSLETTNMRRTDSNHITDMQKSPQIHFDKDHVVETALKLETYQDLVEKLESFYGDVLRSSPAQNSSQNVSTFDSILMSTAETTKPSVLLVVGSTWQDVEYLAKAAMDESTDKEDVGTTNQQRLRGGRLLKNNSIRSRSHRDLTRTMDRANDEISTMRSSSTNATAEESLMPWTFTNNNAKKTTTATWKSREKSDDGELTRVEQDHLLSSYEYLQSIRNSFPNVDVVWRLPLYKRNPPMKITCSGIEDSQGYENYVRLTPSLPLGSTARLLRQTYQQVLASWNVATWDLYPFSYVSTAHNDVFTEIETHVEDFEEMVGNWMRVATSDMVALQGSTRSTKSQP